MYIRIPNVYKKNRPGTTWVYVYIYILYISTCTHTHIYIYIYMYTRIYIYTYLQIRKEAMIYPRVYPNVLASLAPDAEHVDDAAMLAASI